MFNEFKQQREIKPQKKPQTRLWPVESYQVYAHSSRNYDAMKFHRITQRTKMVKAAPKKHQKPSYQFQTNTNRIN